MLSNKPNQGSERHACWNYRSLLKEIKEDKSKLKDSPCLWIRRLNIINMLTMLPTKVIYIVNITPMKITLISFVKNRKTHPKIHKELQGMLYN